MQHLVGSNDKIDINWKKEYLGHRLFLVAINIAVDEPRTRNISRPYRRESSQHQEFELNQPASTPPLHVPSIGNVLVILRGPTGQYIFDKVNHPGIVSSHVFDQTAISGPLNSHAHSLISLCAHDTIWSEAHRHIQVSILPSHAQHRQVARGSYIRDIKDNWEDFEYIEHNADHEHHAQQRSYNHNQVQRRQHGRRLTSSSTSETSASQHPHR